MEKNTVNKSEVEKFEKLAGQWWQDNGSFSSLHKINPVRLEFIKNEIDSHFNRSPNQLTILDVGCGGGIASIPLARLGFNVTGIDAGKKNIEIATNYAKERNIEIKFLNETAEIHLEKKIQYDVIICLEMIEHVNHIQTLIDSLVNLLNPGGIIIISTINRTLKARILAIWLAEYVLNLLPKYTHDFDNFVKPSEIDNFFEKTSLKITKIQGIYFDIIAQKWILSDNIEVNYICVVR